VCSQSLPSNGWRHCGDNVYPAVGWQWTFALTLIFRLLGGTSHCSFLMVVRPKWHIGVAPFLPFPSFLLVMSTCDSVSQIRRLFSNRYHSSLFKCARPERHPPKVRSIQVHHLHPKFLSFPLSRGGGETIPRGRCFYFIGFCSMCSFYFRFGRGRPSTSSCFSPSTTRWASRLLASQILALRSSCGSCRLVLLFPDETAVLSSTLRCRSRDTLLPLV
jgi:hypothetical protein